MDFENRIKKEMTEGIVKAILEDAGYRVIDSGIEKVIRELSCMSSFEYAKLAYPDAMSRLAASSCWVCSCFLFLPLRSCPPH
ncbi:hypothetical protein [Ralstonia mannitolilytica]|uniref:hypothetical protein n=1 Tax=Ralstonia mannitolilytica TaxID=105219 RepID=UPI0028F6505B|nr:hypothetical protein [Ralstonia mannitolilytica]CAJ0736137.1 hypothetical protein R76706_04014 [Ralstonia mannitolilytica]